MRPSTRFLSFCQNRRGVDHVGARREGGSGIGNDGEGEGPGASGGAGESQAQPARRVRKGEAKTRRGDD